MQDHLNKMEKRMNPRWNRKHISLLPKPKSQMTETHAIGVRRGPMRNQWIQKFWRRQCRHATTVIRSQLSNVANNY